MINIFVICEKKRKQLLDRGLAALTVASKNVAHKAAETTDTFIGSKIVDKIVKQKPVFDRNSKNVKEIIIPPEKREEILNKLRQIS